jgi:hypothetical protein
VKTTIVLATLAVAAALPAQSHASDGAAWSGAPDESQEAPPAIQAPTMPPQPPGPRWGAIALRLDLSDQFFGGSLTGVEVSGRFWGPFGVDLALGQNDMGYGHTGVAAEAMARLYLFDQASGGVSLAAGPSFRNANEFGTVGFMTGEIAAEYRPRGGFSVLVGTGMSVALNDSGQAQCPDNGILSCFLWTDHYSQGDKTLNLRLAVGASF